MRKSEKIMQVTRDRFIHIIAAGALIAAIGSALPAAHAADVIKIGAPLALTGSLADEAKKQDVVWKMWLDKVNAAGGINVGGKKMKVELVKYDYQSDGQRAAQLAEKLITDDKVDFLLSPFGSGHTKIVATVAERYQNLRAREAEAMCDHVWIFGARTLSTQPVRVTQESGRRGPAPGEYPASDAAYPLFHIQALLTKTPIFWRSVSEGPILTR
jgi:hypothetical protein